MPSAQRPGSEEAGNPKDPHGGSSPEPRRRVNPLLWLLIGAGLASAAVYVGLFAINAAVMNAYREKAERGVSRHDLRTFAEAHELVKAGTGRYWREDVAAFGDFPLVDRRVALADDRGARRDTLGYLFRSLPFSDEAAPDPKRYAILCFPVRPEGFMYALTHERRLWRKKAIATGVSVFPADPASAGWESLPP